MDCASVMYGAATDSVRLPFFLLHVKLTSATKTSCTLRSFFALMSLHPLVMQRAQEDIDRVTEGERLPTFEDWERLPYINAIILEVLRYNTVTPLGEHFLQETGIVLIGVALVTGLPHSVAKDDIYNGMLIPEGSMICANLWCVWSSQCCRTK